MLCAPFVRLCFSFRLLSGSLDWLTGTLNKGSVGIGGAVEAGNLTADGLLVSNDGVERANRILRGQVFPMCEL